MPRGDLVKALAPPAAGARSDLAPHLMEADSVPTGSVQNVIWRDGFLVNRPGLRDITGTTMTGRPMGGFRFRTGTSTFSVIGTTTKLYRLNSGATGFDDLTGPTVPSGSADTPWRFAVFPSGGSDWLIGVNRTNTPQKWDGSAATFVDVGGTVYPAGDVTTSANRVIIVDTLESGVRYLYRVRWSDFNDLNTWGANSFADLSDTPDVMIGAQALSRVAFAIYKENSQWIGLAQEGTFPFKFELQDLKPGPVSPSAVVAANGRHWYLGNDGSIYTFDGIRATHVGEPIRRFVTQNFNFDQKERCFGVYVRRDRDIYWFFPSPGKDDPDRAISLNVDTGAFWPHVFRQTVSCGFEWSLVATVNWNGLSSLTWNNVAGTYSSWESFGSVAIPAEALGGTGGKLYRFGVDATDDGLAPAVKWRFANMTLSKTSRRCRVQSMNTYFAQASAALTVTVKTGTTDTLAVDPTFPAALTSTHDISQDTLHQTDYDTAASGTGSGTAEAQFVSLQHELDTTVDWKWAGAHLRGYQQETA